MKKRILGLDTGTNSLGWAVVDRNEDGTYTFVRNGVLIFPEGVKPKNEKKVSKAAERTGYRASRRQYFRRRLRKIETLKVLIKYGLCPRLSDEELHEWHVHKRYPMNEEFLQWQRTNENEQKNPYYYRHRCLHETLDMESPGGRYVLGRALYHLAQRRGFLSNRLDTSKDKDKETGIVKNGISKLSEEMKTAGCEFLGDYFYRLYKERGNRERIRERYTNRMEHYEKEFRAICERQRLSKEQVDELHRALYFQRPLKSQKHNIGKCKFEKHKSRCIESHPDYEEFRMWQFINNIKVRTPDDDKEELRPLKPEERGKILPMFFRVSKRNFDFEDIAKKLAGKGNYAYYKDTELKKPYLFNYRMSQGVPGCPTTASLQSIWGENWREALAKTYTRNQTKKGMKAQADMVTDVWNVLYSFSSQSKLKAFALDHLQLSEAEAEKFSKINVGRETASISLRAVRKILPFLRQGFIYSHSVFLANIPEIVTPAVWNDEGKRAFILQEVKSLMDNYNPRDTGGAGTLEMRIKDFLQDNFDLKPGAVEKLYHPSMIDTYPKAQLNKDGVLQLGSPATSSIRNPMAMRSLHLVGRLLNKLLRERIIDQHTEVHVEYARKLNDANRRIALERYSKKLEEKRKKAQEELAEHYKEETGQEIEPKVCDVKKYLLWSEQDGICLYTGASIGIADFVGENSDFDFEHTIPRSRGGDSTMMNKTLCSSRFNRQTKKDKLPAELSEHEAILERIGKWKEKITSLKKQIDQKRTHSSMPKEKKDKIIQQRHELQLEYDYLNGKYSRFLMTEVPEGFSRRQGVGIGLISKYAGLYLKSLFHNVYVVKGEITDEFRHLWELQDEDEKKSRDNHVHHCMDAVVIACIGKQEYDAMADYYRQVEKYEWALGDKSRRSKPKFPKPWKTFTEDVNHFADTLLVPHLTPNVFSKKGCKNIPAKRKSSGSEEGTDKQEKTSKKVYKAQGDSVRGSLHLDTYYGAIMRDGKLKYVVRKALAKLEEDDVKNIVDDVVRRIVEDEIKQKGFKAAMADPIYMNRDKGILINKVRLYCPKVKNPLDIRKIRDESPKKYKRTYHVMNDGNYAMAIYEGEMKGEIKRDFELVNCLDAARFYKRSTKWEANQKLVSGTSKQGLPLRCLLRGGTMVLFWEKTPNEIWALEQKELRNRLYKVVAIESDGRIQFRFHQEARRTEDLKKLVEVGKKGASYKQDEPYRPLLRLSVSKFNALVEGVDFEITILGEIRPLKKD